MKIKKKITEKNKNIGIVTAWFPSGAGYVSRQYKEILEKDSEVYIYARGGITLIGDPLWDSTNVTWAPPHGEITGIHWRHFREWVKKNKIELVFFNEQRYWPTVIKAKSIGLKIGAYIDYYTQDTIPFFALFDFLICNTRRHYSVFDWHSKSYLVPWGVPKSRWPRQATLDKKIPVFIISGGWDGAYSKINSWMDRRGVGTTIKVFRRLKGACKLLVYSQVPLKECPLTWQDDVAGDSRIKFICGTFEPFPFDSGSVYVYPSRLDGIGLTVPEAICAGLPVITTDSPPMSEFVVDGINGSLIKVKRQVSRPDGYYWPESIVCENSLLEAMQKYVDDIRLVKEQSKRSIEYAVQFFQWETNAKRLPEIFAEPLEVNVPDKTLLASIDTFNSIQLSTIRVSITRAIKNMLQRYPGYSSVADVFKQMRSKLF